MSKINHTTHQRPICNNNLKDNIKKPVKKQKQSSHYRHRMTPPNTSLSLQLARKTQQNIRNATLLLPIFTATQNPHSIRNTTTQGSSATTVAVVLALTTLLISTTQAVPISSYKTVIPKGNSDIIVRQPTIAFNNGIVYSNDNQPARLSDVKNNSSKQHIALVETSSKLQTENKEKISAKNKLNMLFLPYREQAAKYIVEKNLNINDLINFISNNLAENIKANIIYKDGNLLIIPKITLAETTDTVTGDPIKLKLHSFISTFLNAHASNSLTEDQTAPNNISNFIGIDLDSLSKINEFFLLHYEDICKVDNKNNKDMEAFIHKTATISIDGKSLITTLAEFNKLIKDDTWKTQEVYDIYDKRLLAFAKSDEFNNLIDRDMQNKNSIHKKPILRGITIERMLLMFLLDIMTQPYVSNILSYPDALSTQAKDLAAKKTAYNESIALINSYKYRELVRDLHSDLHNINCPNYEDEFITNSSASNEDNLADATPMMFELINSFEKSSGDFNNDAHLQQARELALALINPIFSYSNNGDTITIKIPKEIHDLAQLANVNNLVEFHITDKSGQQLPILNKYRNNYTLVGGFLAAYVNQCGASNIQVKGYRNGKQEIYNIKVPGFNKNNMSKQGFKSLLENFNKDYRKMVSWLLDDHKVEPTIENLYTYAPVVTLDVAKGTVSGEIFGSEYETKLNNIATDGNTSEAGKLKHLLVYLENLNSKVSNQILRVTNVSEDFGNSASDPKLKPDFIKTSHKCENFNLLFFKHSNNFVSYEIIGKENTNFLQATNILVNTDSTKDNNTSTYIVLDKFTIDKFKDHNIAHILTEEFEKNHQLDLKELSPEQKQMILHNSLRKLPLHKIINNYDKKTGEPRIRANIVVPLIKRLYNPREYSLQNTIKLYLDEYYIQRASAILTKLPSEFKATEEKPRVSLKLTVIDGELRVSEATLSYSQQVNSASSKELKLDIIKYFNVNPIIALNIATKIDFDIDTYVGVKGRELLISRNDKPKNAYKLARINLVNNNIHYRLPFTNEDTLPKISSHLRDEL
jgi:hypothetical protein